MKRKISILALAGLSLLTTACFDDMFGPVEPVGPSVKTGEITNAAQTSFKISGTISNPGYKNKRQEKKSGQVVEYGFVYGTSDNPREGNIFKTGDAIATFPHTFEATITGLRANTAYKVWTYAKTEAGVTEYGNEAGQQTSDFPTPVPTFSWTLPNGNRAPAQIQFTTTDNTPGAQYRWEFGSEGTSTQKNPAFVFNTGGTKNVKLTITANGKTAERVVTVSIAASYNNVRISRIQLLAAPAKKPNGSDWDGWDLFNSRSSYPDLFVQGSASSAQQFVTSNVIRDVSQDQIAAGQIAWSNFSPQKTFPRSEYTNRLYLWLYDADSGSPNVSSSERMGEASLVFGDHASSISNPKYPSSLTIGGTGAYRYKVDLVWSE